MQFMQLRLISGSFLGPNVGANRPRGTPELIDHADPTPLAPRARGPVQRLVIPSHFIVAYRSRQQPIPLKLRSLFAPFIRRGCSV